ncbi:MAG TPA: glycoside hydrolase family 44 protein [Terriglobales bacterium]|nr:glycoside hydrolase family 44 protein [Terriglobales bacterium]
MACCLPLIVASQAAAQVSVSVDATANQRPISPLIYGVAFGSAAQLSDLNAPANRWGGNSTTRYNWQVNSHNTASDYYYESIGSGTPGQDADNFISDAKSNGAQPMMTIPIIDWLAKAGPNHPYLCSYPTSQFPSQQFVDPFQTNCGNGILPNGTEITGADPNTANVPNSTTIQTQWVQHLVGKWGAANQGGLQYYLLDNEHTIWYGTHRDVHPNGPGMDELFQKMRDYSLAVKTVDPGAIVLGPEEWGWDGYFYSGKDQQLFGQGNFSTPDKVAHNNAFYIPWLLDQFHQYETANGKRLLDVLSVHYYPQGDVSSGRQEFSNDDSAATQALRNQSTRSLWDLNYVDKSWIPSTGINGGIVKLIPLLKQWVSQHYPGLNTAITEYNWGDEANMNGATTQADIYGIFGREGLDIGTRWTTPATTTPTYKAMKMYRNYDGNKSTFGETSVKTTVPNPDHVSAFSALRSSDGALTIMLINKDAGTPGPQANVSLANFQASGVAHVWQLSANAIKALSDINFASNTISLTLPPQSVTLLIVDPAKGDFTVAVSNPVQTVLANQTATFTGTLTALNGYSSPVTVSCSIGKPTSCSSTMVTPTAGGAAFSISASNPAGGDFTFNLVASGSDPKATTHQQPVTLHVSDFSVSVSNSVQTVVEGQTATFTGTLTSQNGYGNSVTVSCGTGAPATCNSTTVTPTPGGAAFNITATNPTGGDFTFNLVATGSDSQTITHQQQVTLHVSDFTVSVSNPVQTVLANQSATFNGTLTAINGYNSSVTVSCGAGAPPTCPAASPVTPTAGGAPFSLSASSNTTGDYSFNLVGTGSDASTTTRSQPVTLHVVSASTDLAVALGRVPSISHVMVGTLLSYTATVTNNGPTTTAATLTLTFSKAVHMGALPNGCTGAGPVQCTTAALSTGQNASFPLSLIAPLTHDLKVTATVLSSTAADPDPSNNTAKDSVRVYLRPIRHAEDRGAP